MELPVQLLPLLSLKRMDLNSNLKLRLSRAQLKSFLSELSQTALTHVLTHSVTCITLSCSCIKYQLSNKRCSDWIIIQMKGGDSGACAYVVTAHKSTAVTHTVVGNFTSPTDLNLIVGKHTRIEGSFEIIFMIRRFYREFS